MGLRIIEQHQWIATAESTDERPICTFCSAYHVHRVRIGHEQPVEIALLEGRTPAIMNEILGQEVGNAQNYSGLRTVAAASVEVVPSAGDAAL
jgi:hypothetical protein